MSDIIQRSYDAATRLAKLLHNEPWYHRTSTTDGRMNGTMRTWITVWGEGPRPDNLPKEFDGFAVEYNCVSAKHPCPLGSVKDRYSDE